MNFDYRLDNARHKSHCSQIPSFQKVSHRRSDSIDLSELRNGSDVTKYSLITNNFFNSPSQSPSSASGCDIEPMKEIDLNVITKELNRCKRRFSEPLDKSARAQSPDESKALHHNPKIKHVNSKSFEDICEYLSTSSNPRNYYKSKSSNDIGNEYDLKEFLQSLRIDMRTYNETSTIDANNKSYKYAYLELPSSSVDLLTKYEANVAKGNRRSLSNTFINKIKSLKRYKSH